MPMITTLKSSHTREKKALVREKTEADTLIQAEWSDNPQEMLKLSLSTGKVLLSLEMKLARLETTNDKLVEALEQAAELILDGLEYIPQQVITRNITISDDPIEYTLLCFSDASSKAHATVIYLHQISKSSTRVDLIFSKIQSTSLSQGLNY